MQGMLILSLGQKDLPEKEMATHSSVLAWKILWTEEPGGLRSMGLQRFGHDGTTNTRYHYSFFWGEIKVFRSLKKIWKILISSFYKS